MPSIADNHQGHPNMLFSWNTKLSYDRAFQMGGEFRRKGVHVALGPVVGPLGRVAEGGRSWEGRETSFLINLLSSLYTPRIQRRSVPEWNIGR